MAATVDVAETNGIAPGTRLDGITNSNYGSIDTANLVPESNPLVPGTNSFEKWQQIKLTALGGAAQIKNFKYYASGAPATAASALFNGHTTQGTYDVSKKTVYETPGTGITKVPNAVPIVAPGSANIGIGGSLLGALSAPSTYSDYIVSGISTTGAAIAGNTRTITFGYDEIA